MSITEVWLIRHGQTGANSKGVIQGHLDEPLDETGREQARALGRWLAERSPGWDSGVAVISSPLCRATETATLATAHLGSVTRPDSRWMERSFGEWEGRPANEVYGQFPREGPGILGARPPRGETGNEHQARVVEALESLGENRGPVLVFTHGGSVAAVLCHVLGLPHEVPQVLSFKRDNTGVTTLERSRSGKWRVGCLNARPHLVGP